ncbi:MAG: sugar phosphate isomerase/epimerase [Candidatus Thorarchaeota archaeon]|nr:sugar phosphate isomerase/epimerase [Candidatus Thorarchaeota archaeon]
MPFRFGLTALDFQSTAQQVIVDGIPDFSLVNVVNPVRDTATSGFSVAEISMDAQYILDSIFTPKAIDQLVDLKDELGLAYTIHLPFWSIELATFNEPVRQGSVKSQVECIRLAERLEPEAYVLHATGALAAEFSTLPYSNNTVRLICMLLSGFSMQSIEEIITQTEIKPRRLAIENCMFPFDVTRDMIDDLDTSICFDTAHLITHMSGNESVMEFYATHKDRIIEIHLQDGIYHEYDGAIAREDHVALGRGIMGDEVLREFLLALSADDFDGPIIFELTRSEAQESLDKIKHIVPEVL